MRLFPHILAVVLLILAYANAKADTTQPPSPSAATTGAKKIVIIGDSITEGYGVSRAQAYPALLQNLIEKDKKAWRVINAGISGSTSASALSRVQWHLKQKPDLLLIALGANDGLRGSSTEEMRANLEAAIKEAQNAKVPVMLAGMRMPPNYGDYSKRFDEVFPALARKHQIPFIPFLLDGVAGDAKLNLADGIHPNEKGHVVISEKVYKLIKKQL